jgi:hypothetical protein
MVSDLSNDLPRKAACQKLRGSLSGLGDINIFVACFCEDGDLLSQWRGYSESSAGKPFHATASFSADVSTMELFRETS